MIGFLLQPNDRHVMTIRPEDLQWSEPMRTSVVQTFGGAWFDTFGSGIEMITISGHTGWRALTPSGRDWFDEFNSLYAVAFTKWKEQVAASRDPQSVKLFFLDALDGRSARVVPMSFQLKRNKARPLLMQYNISLAVVGRMEDFVPEDAPLSAMAQFRAAMKSLSRTLTIITNFIQQGRAVARGDFGTAMNVVYSVFGSGVGDAVTSVIDVSRNSIALSYEAMHAAQDVSALPDELALIAKRSSAAARALFLHLSAQPHLSNVQKGLMSGAAAEFNNAVCLFSNAFKTRKSYPDYDAVYGASACSSTSGGRPESPLADVNPFAVIAGQRQVGAVTQNLGAATAARDLITADPVLAPLPQGTLVSQAIAIAAGTSFPAGKS